MSAVSQIGAFYDAERAKTPMVDVHQRGYLDGIRAVLEFMKKQPTEAWPPPMVIDPQAFRSTGEPAAAPQTTQEPTTVVRIPTEHLDAYIKALQGMRSQPTTSSRTYWQHAGEAELHGDEILDAIVSQTKED